MRKTITTCDLCGKECNTAQLKLPVYRMFDSCDGRTFYDEPKVSFKDIDICTECLPKITNIYDDSVMGYGTLSIRKNPQLDKD